MLVTGTTTNASGAVRLGFRYIVTNVEVGRADAVSFLELVPSFNSPHPTATIANSNPKLRAAMTPFNERVIMMSPVIS